MPDAYLGAGSNLGDRRGQLAEAVRRLHRPPRDRVVVVSAVYESKPVGITTQPDFLNLVLKLVTTRLPHELLAECLRIEAELGRVRRERNGPRTIDLDVLLYDDLEIADATLTLPHPRMRERGFVLVPLAEIAPDLRLGGELVPALAARFSGEGLIKRGPLGG